MHLEMVLRCELPREVEAPFRARQAVSPLAEDFDWRAADIMLVVSELVTNSVRHASGGPIEVRAQRTPGGLEVEVCDPPPGFDPPARDIEHARLGEGGLGLAVVDALTDEWGVRSNGEACVWARFDLSHISG
jgi:anti-sigma regulatory factor (Ser/Thr protein kinase)